MSSRDGVDPSRSQGSAETHPLPDQPAAGDAGSGEAPAAPTWGWSGTAPSWAEPVTPGWGHQGADQAGADRPTWARGADQAGADRPTWAQGAGLDPTPTQPGWGQGYRPDQPAAPEGGAGADQHPTVPGWGQGGGSGWGDPPGQARGGRPATPDGQRARGGLNRALVAGVVAIVLAAGSYGVGQAVGRNASSGTAAPAAGVPVPAAASPTRSAAAGATEPVAEVAKALLPTIVEIRTGEGLGSGVVYDRNGYILTAAHVVEGTQQVRVRLADGSQVDGRVLGTDQTNDVGVVKINKSGLTAAPLALGVKLEVGQTAVAIGSPFGLDQTVTAGVVSAVSRAIDAQTANGQQTVRQVLQTDAPINPGNSGGALADRQGRVIGINDAIETGNENSGGGQAGNVGIGFAIPIDIAARSAQSIVQGKPIRTAFIGVSSSDSTTSQGGALVESVINGGPADKAGIQTGDMIVAVNGQAVHDSGDLAAQIRALAPGQKVELKLLRGGRQETVTVTLGDNPNG